MGKFLAAILLLWGGSQTIAFAATKQGRNPVKAEISMNGLWQFKTDPANEGEKQLWFANNSIKFPDALPVPGNWNTQNEYANCATYQSITASHRVVIFNLKD
jgi:beta-galactosidase/beta-glucuronidase